MEQSVEVGDVWIAKDQSELEIEVFVVSGDTVVCKLTKDWGGYVKGELVTYTKDTLFRIYAKEVDKVYFDGYQEGYKFGHLDGKKESAPTTERERQLQEKAWDEGYASAIKDYLAQGGEFVSNKGCYVSCCEFGAIDDSDNTPNKETREAMQEVLDKDDAVSNPKHYNSDPSGVKCIEITRHRNNNIGNVIKYLWRNGLKDGNSNIQDLEKGAWYLNDEIQRLKGLNNGLE